MKFEWDSAKERINIEKHGVTFEQASYVFADPFALTLYDDAHSEDAIRWVQEEFAALWQSPFAVELADAVVQDVKRLAERRVIPDLDAWRK